MFGGLFDFFDSDHDFDTGGPGFFSSRVMAVFVTAFGGFGAVATYYGLAPVPASLVGFGSGLVFGGAIYALARFLYNQQASTEVRAGDLVGAIGRVVIGIPPGGVGQIRVRLGEELMDKIARTRDGARDRREHVRADRRSARRNGHRQENLRAGVPCQTMCSSRR